MAILEKLIAFVKSFLLPKKEPVRAPAPPTVKGRYGWMISMPCNEQNPRCLANWRLVFGTYVGISQSEEYEVTLSHLNIEQGLERPEKSRNSDTHVIQIVKKDLNNIDKRVMKRYLISLAYMDGSNGRPSPDLTMKQVTRKLCYDMINVANGFTDAGIELSVRTSVVKWLGHDRGLTYLKLNQEL